MEPFWLLLLGSLIQRLALRLEGLAHLALLPALQMAAPVARQLQAAIQWWPLAAIALLLGVVVLEVLAAKLLQVPVAGVPGFVLLAGTLRAQRPEMLVLVAGKQAARVLLVAVVLRPFWVQPDRAVLLLLLVLMVVLMPTVRQGVVLVVV
jgi:hypothetical protein